MSFMFQDVPGSGSSCRLLVSRKPVAYNSGLLWGFVAFCFELLGFRGMLKEARWCFKGLWPRSGLRLELALVRAVPNFSGLLGVKGDLLHWPIMGC